MKKFPPPTIPKMDMKEESFLLLPSFLSLKEQGGKNGIRRPTELPARVAREETLKSTF